METSDKYRKKKESYSPYQVNYHKNAKYHHSHERFVVPWQMDDEKLIEEKDK